MRALFSTSCILLLALMAGADAEPTVLPEAEAVTGTAGDAELDAGTEQQPATDLQPEGEVEPVGDALLMSDQETVRYRELEGRAVQTFSNADLADYLTLRDRAVKIEGRRFVAHEEMGRLARRTAGQIFRLNAVQHDLAESDCVVLVNRTIAMSLASDWGSYYLLSERLRHKDGVIAYRNRNFSTLGDWLPNNAWLLQDITPLLGRAGNQPAREFTHVIRPKVFEEFPAAPGSKYTRIVFKGSDYKSPEQRIVTDTYIPSARVRDIADELQTGDIALVLREGAGGRFGCEHMGLIAREDSGLVTIIHSAPPGVKHEPLSVFMRRCNWVKGYKFLRLKDNAVELAAQERARMATVTTPPFAAVQDTKVAAMRARRSQPK